MNRSRRQTPFRKGCLLTVCWLLFFSGCAGCPDSTDAQSFSVMTYNVGDCCDTPPSLEDLAGAIRDYASRSAPEGGLDVVFMQEFRQAKTRKELREFGRELGFPYVTWVKTHDSSINWLTILSRYKLSNIRTVPLTASKTHRVALAADMDLNGTPVLLVNVHFDHFDKVRNRDGDVMWASKAMLRAMGRELLAENVRSRMADQLVDWVAGQHADQVVVGGDLNTFPLSSAARSLGARLDDALWPSLEYFHGTYRRVHSWVQPRVDFIFHGPGLSADHGRVRDTNLGDHRPVQSRFHVCMTH